MSNSRKKNLFYEVPVMKVPRNVFDLSHEVKMSGKFGILYPILLMDALPGDTIRDQMTAFLRFAPLLAPVMHRIDVTTHFFFVPNRILTDHWEDFITGGQDGLASPTLPYITPQGFSGDPDNSNLLEKGTLWDYLGLPVKPSAVAATSTQQITALPFRAYAKVWNDFYRDPNLDNELDLDTDLQGNVTSQSIDAGLFQLRNRMWEKDYFTSALPWAQRGAEVLMPLSGSGDLVLETADDDPVPAGKYLGTLPLSPGTLAYGDSFNPGVNTQAAKLMLENSDVSINDLRRALAIQKWLENNARGGGRYIEQIETHFNTRVPDYRLQRAEYLGGGRQPVQISEVLQQSDEGASSSPLGTMGGHGISVGKSNRFTYRCQEHGWVIGILSVVPRTAYSQGLDKMWTRQTKFDYPWPELAKLGEQEILSKEVFYSFAGADDEANEGVFGYIPRYAEMKFKNDRIAGDFRDTLDFWHLGRIFTSRPVLDPQFTTMYENNTADEDTYRRIFAVQDGTDYLWMQLYHHCTAKRPLPYFGVPSIGNL